MQEIRKIKPQLQLHSYLLNFKFFYSYISLIKVEVEDEVIWATFYFINNFKRTAKLYIFQLIPNQDWSNRFETKINTIQFQNYLVFQEIVKHGSISVCNHQREL